MSGPGEWFSLRSDWFRVEVLVRPAGGFDVVLVIDGSYGHVDDALRAAEHHRQVLARLVEARRSGRSEGTGDTAA